MSAEHTPPSGNLLTPLDRKVKQIKEMQQRIDALQAELDQLRGARLLHADTHGYVLVPTQPEGVAFGEGENACDLYPDMQAARDASYQYDHATVAAVVPLELFEADQ